jgi:hypothetical protein
MKIVESYIYEVTTASVTGTIAVSLGNMWLFILTIVVIVVAGAVVKKEAQREALDRQARAVRRRWKRKYRGA